VQRTLTALIERLGDDGDYAGTRDYLTKLRDELGGAM
jgi:hypothetical protein